MVNECGKNEETKLDIVKKYEVCKEKNKEFYDENVKLSRKLKNLEKKYQKLADMYEKMLHSQKYLLNAYEKYDNFVKKYNLLKEIDIEEQI